MTIVCLGWGSLIWDPRDLPIAGEWSDDGPLLPLEFARESADGRMTLVVVDHDAPVPTFWAPLDVESVDRAVVALLKREGADWYGAIGRWPLGSRDHRQARTVGAWMESKGFDGVVWTDLRPGFRDDRTRMPTLGEILRHLEGLPPEARARAAEYVFSAPPQILTPFRAKIEALLKQESG